MGEAIYSVIYTENVKERFWILSDARRAMLKEFLAEQEIYLKQYPEIYQIYENKDGFRKFSLKISKNDGYVFLYKIDHKRRFVVVAEFYHFLEDYYEYEQEDKE